MVDRQQLKEDIVAHKKLIIKYYPDRISYTYKGVRVVKTPHDLWIYHELLWELRPKILVELGTERGGSAMWFADQIREFGGRVYSLDKDPSQRVVKEYPGVEFITADVSDPSTVDFVKAKIDDEPVIVVHDANHKTVYEDFVLWNGVVSIGSYFVVEDTTDELVGRKGPLVGDTLSAVKKILKNFPNFEVDYRWNKCFLTCCFAGFLKRIK